MKPPERYEPDDPREWMNRARSNLRRAADQTPGTYLEDMCFDAQQATEKALKAILVARAIDFPYIHDLAELTRILEADGLESPSGPPGRPTDAVRDFNQVSRAHEPVTDSEYEVAVKLAEAVVHWAEGRL